MIKLPKFIVVILILTIPFPCNTYGEESTIISGETSIKKSVKSWSEIRDEGVVRQKYDYSCGTAAVATVLSYFFNDKVSEREVLEFLLERLEQELKSREKIKSSDFAFSFSDLRLYAESRGYKALGLAMPMETLRKLKVPAILYVETRDYEHFTVFRGIDDRFVYLADPSFGNLKVRIERFRDSFYTRDDLRFPGKGLVLIPESRMKKTSVNSGFMETERKPDFVEKVISNKTVTDTIP